MASETLDDLTHARFGIQAIECCRTGERKNCFDVLTTGFRGAEPFIFVGPAYLRREGFDRDSSTTRLLSRSPAASLAF